MTLKQREEAQFLLKMPITFHINVLEDAGKQTAATSPLQGLILLILWQMLCGPYGTFGAQIVQLKGQMVLALSPWFRKVR